MQYPLLHKPLHQNLDCFNLGKFLKSSLADILFSFLTMFTGATVGGADIKR